MADDLTIAFSGAYIVFHRSSSNTLHLEVGSVEDGGEVIIPIAQIQLPPHIAAQVSEWLHASESHYPYDPIALGC